MKQNNTKRLKVKANPNPKKAMMATLMSDTLVFKAERNTWGRHVISWKLPWNIKL